MVDTRKARGCVTGLGFEVKQVSLTWAFLEVSVQIQNIIKQVDSKTVYIFKYMIYISIGFTTGP